MEAQPYFEDDYTSTAENIEVVYEYVDGYKDDLV